MGVRQAVQEARLYGILDLGYVEAGQAVAMAKRMLEGGVQILQLRGKGRPIDLLAELGKEVAPLCREAGVPFLINDFPELVQPTGADGVHIGQDDMSVPKARMMAGSGAIVGKSTHSLEQVRQTLLEGPDYIGFGPLFATATKPDYVPIGMAEITTAHTLIPCPIFCIGGIKRDNLAAVLTAGATRVVVVSGILQALAVEGYCRDLLAAIPLLPVRS
ncbi:thiamine phosphate synthase [soil metagenome]